MEVDEIGAVRKRVVKSSVGQTVGEAVLREIQQFGGLEPAFLGLLLLFFNRFGGPFFFERDWK